jgi:dTDP-4-dehydrorhamnose reductase
MRILITGASGQLGGYLLLELRRRQWDAIAWSGTRAGQLFGFDLRPVNLADPDQLASAFEQARPTLVIHTAAITTLAACYRDPPSAWRINAHGTRVMAELSARAGARFLLVSTDLVFDGAKGSYREEDEPAPLSTYGQTKVAAEQAALACPGGVVVRVSLLFGPSVIGRRAFFDEQLAAFREGRPVSCFTDEWRSPLGLLPTARGLLAIAESDHVGMLHMGGPERLTRLEMGERLAQHVGADSGLIVRTTRESFAAGEPRPRDTSLDSTRFHQRFPELRWPSWEESLREMFAARDEIGTGNA